MLSYSLVVMLIFLSTPAYATNWVGEASCINAWLMDESSGSIIDSCGTNDLGASGSPTYSQTGQFGTSIGFNGSTPDFFFSEQADVTTEPFTFVAWGNPDDVTNGHTLVWIGDRTQVDEMQTIVMGGDQANDPIRAFSFSTAGGFDESTKTSFTANFHHAAGVWATTTSRIAYLDGVAGTENTASNEPSGEQRTAVGMLRDGSPGFPMFGDIDEAAIFDVALDSTDINDIMDNGLVQVAALGTVIRGDVVIR